jgi:hypothetical protein
MLVRLTRKLAERINGIDLCNRAVGDVMELPDREALALVAEGWAVWADLSTESGAVVKAAAGQRSGTSSPRTRRRA